MARVRRSPSSFRDRRPPAALGLGLLLGLLGAGLAAPSGCVLDSSGIDPSEDGSGTPCASVAECDDANACTADACTEGVCRSVNDDGLQPGDGNDCTADTCVQGTEKHTVQPGLSCGEGGVLMCNAQGQCTGCTSPAQCGTDSVCETWTCVAAVCEPNRPPRGTELPDPTPADCKSMACDGLGMAVEVPKADDIPPDDGVECTERQCNAGEPVFPQSPADTVCTDTISYCNTLGTCVPCTATIGCMPDEACFNEMGCVSCTDGVQNGGETGVDCGGACLACDGQNCNNDNMCATGNCENNFCISCVDGEKNGDESDTDCGGSCPDCMNGKICATGGDCASTFCADGVCCDTLCDGACSFCGYPGTNNGVCTFIPQGSEDNNPSCDNPTVCNGAGACVADGGKKHYGESCTTNPDCFNNACDFGICRLKAGDPCSTDNECRNEDCINFVCDS